MKKVKRILALVLSLMMILSALAGCGSSGGSPSAAGSGGASSGKTESGWPERNITVIVPFDAGGATDLIARAMQSKMQESLGTTTTVQNMSGGSTAIGNQYVLDSEPDGYTVCMQATEICNIWTMNYSDITYRDFKYVGIAASVPGVFVVKSDSPYNTIEDVIQAMKSGKKLTVGTCGGGDAWTLTFGLFANSIEGATQPEYISEGSGKNAAVAAMKGEVDIGSCGIPEAFELLKGGQLRALACCTPEDSDIEGYGAIPSIVNTCPDLAKFMPYGGFVGMCVSKEVPDEIVNKLIEAFDYAFKSEEVQSYLTTSYFLPLGHLGADAESFVAQFESLNASLLWDLEIGERDPAGMGIVHY